MNYYAFLETPLGKTLHKTPVGLQRIIIYCVASIVFFLNINSVQNDFKKALTGVFENRSWRWIAYRSYLRSFGNFIDLGILMHKPEDYVQKTFAGKVDIENAHFLTEALDSGRGVFIVSAHFALFHLVFFADAPHIQNITIIRRFDSEGRVNLFERMSRLTGKAIDSVFMSPSAGLKVFKQLKKGGICACMFDYYYEDTNVIISPFMGRDAATPLGVSMLAHNTNSVLLPCVIIKQNARYKLIFGEPINEVEANLKTSIEAVEEEQVYSHLITYTEKLNLFFENYILSVPEQWSFWRSLPKRWAIADYLTKNADAES